MKNVHWYGSTIYAYYREVLVKPLVGNDINLPTWPINCCRTVLLGKCKTVTFRQHSTVSIQQLIFIYFIDIRRFKTVNYGTSLACIKVSVKSDLILPELQQYIQKMAAFQPPDRLHGHCEHFAVTWANQWHCSLREDVDYCKIDRKMFEKKYFFNRSHCWLLLKDHFCTSTSQGSAVTVYRRDGQVYILSVSIRKCL